MWHLAARLASRGLRTSTTTTTRLAAGEEPEGTPVLTMSGDCLPPGLFASTPLVVSRTEGSKHIGITPEQADRLARSLDHLIVEADGARGLPLKLPRPGEPVLPPSTTHLVVVVGLGALDRPAGPDTCFDFDSLVERRLLSPGTPLDAAAIRSLLLGPHGYLPLAVPPLETYILVNGDDSRRASSLADTLWHPALSGVIAASARSGAASLVTNAHSRVAGIVLAAGLSERFGTQKLTKEVDGVPLVRRAVRAALGAGLHRVFLVTGRAAGEVERAAGAPGDPRLTVVRNPRPEEGMGSSLRLGLGAARAGADAVMIFLADMPGVDASLASSVLDAYTRSAARVAAPLSGDRTGHPVILRSDLFDAIDGLTGESGARSIIDDNLDRSATISPDPASQHDVDTPEDLERFTAGSGS